MKTRWLSAFALMLVTACGKSTPTDAPATSSLASGSAAHGASSAAPPASVASAPTGSAALSAWTGKYKSAAGSLYIPRDAPNGKQWKDVKWQGDDSKEGLGEGTITLAIEGRHVSGTLDGPLGPALLEGDVSTEGALTAHVARKDPGDGGFTGTITATLHGAAVEGTMNLSLARANVIRTATFSLAKS
jgi:hypothetical protein